MMAAKYKRMILVAAVVVSATLTWWAAEEWLTGPDLWDGWTSILWPSLAVILMASVTGIAWILLHHRADRWAAIFASWASFILFFPPDIWYVTILPLFVYFWHDARRRIRDEVTSRKRFSIKATLGRGVKFILLGAFLMVSLGFYLLPASRNTDLNDISRAVQGEIEDTYDNAFVRDQLDQLPPAGQQEVKRSIATTVNTFIKKWLGPVAGYIPPILAFALFITFWSVAFAYREVAILLGVGIWKVLKWAKFVEVTETDEKVESVSL